MIFSFLCGKNKPLLFVFFTFFGKRRFVVGDEKKGNGRLRHLTHIPPGPAGVVLVQILGISDQAIWYALWAVAGVLFFVFEVLRHGFRWLQRRFPGTHFEWYTRVEAWALRHGWLREVEVDSLTALTTYSVGIAITFALFGRIPTLIGLQVLALGDPFAREVGMEAKRRGRAHKLYNGKTWEGALGFVVASMAMLVAIDILHIWWPLFHQFGWRIVAVELLAVLAGALVEVFAKRYDNIWIPLASASVVWVLL
ncbi:MAG: hypothetical protein A3G08_01875 [Candidatus Magasanikbacteria bacterium RIFCSPLOWO2_12_FULL_47_9b]|nr:MAG: hypothetical protein A3I74_02050 [Candidatus Magasanikbacteria bacterium RIFCSPLOWO2_02_FULL_47_16]OGH83004.1 MAG: hypothetical protein A3G08_01875 [Candidatus Magasanikbacteria bacterium RIFCSPLOWO2_12_FULL_47_9b]